jgi:hypothetical protein
MDDLLPNLTEALQARLWAAFQQIHHRYRREQIGFNKAIREAYVACAHERLSPEASVARVVHWGLKLKWLAEYTRTGSRVVGYFAGFEPASPPSADPQPIPEAEWRAVVARLVADLIEGKAPRRATMKQARYPVRAAWLQARLAERNWNKHDLARYGGPDHKTTQKVLASIDVQDGVLQKIAQGLSESGAKVSLTEIPQK